jgi:hypothetical protein
MELARMMELTLIRTLLPLFASSWTSFSVRARACTQLFPVSAARAKACLERRLSEPNENIKKLRLDAFCLDFLEQIEFIIIFEKLSCVSKNLQKNLHHVKKFKKVFILTCIASKLSSRPNQARPGIFPRRNFVSRPSRTCDTEAFCLNTSEFFLGFLLRNLLNRHSRRTTSQALMEQQSAVSLHLLKSTILRFLIILINQHYFFYFKSKTNRNLFRCTFPFARHLQLGILGFRFLRKGTLWSALDGLDRSCLNRETSFPSHSSLGMEDRRRIADRSHLKLGN